MSQNNSSLVFLFFPPFALAPNYFLLGKWRINGNNKCATFFYLPFAINAYFGSFLQILPIFRSFMPQRYFGTIYKIFTAQIVGCSPEFDCCSKQAAIGKRVVFQRLLNSRVPFYDKINLGLNGTFLDFVFVKKADDNVQQDLDCFNSTDTTLEISFQKSNES